MTKRSQGGPGRFRVRKLAGALILCLLFAACAARGPEPAPPRTLLATAPTPDRTMMYLHRTDAGILVVDLGWLDAEALLVQELNSMGATPEDVVAVFLTHSHRDHIGAWRRVRHAPFYMGVHEIDRFFGEEEHEGWIPRLADRALGTAGPDRGDVEVRPLAGDSVLVFGQDTMRTFSVPGHTPGSTAFLIDGLLLAGDAIYRSYVGEFRPAMNGYSDDVDLARRSLGELFARLDGHRVERVCTAHARCAPFDEAFRERVLRE